MSNLVEGHVYNSTAVPCGRGQSSFHAWCECNSWTYDGLGGTSTIEAEAIASHEVHVQEQS